jgi:cell division transport system permease protein
MIVKYNILGYLIGEGFTNVFKNKKSTGASLMIMCATMIIFGIFLMLSENINHFVDDIKSEQGFQVFLYNDATDEEIQEVGDKIRALDGVNTVEFKNKEDAMNVMKEKFGDSAYLIESYGADIYSTSYIVTLTDLSLSKDVQNKILEFDNVKRITSSDETVTTLLNLAKGIKIITGVILILLVIISIFIISNTIKLTVHARRKEISIMKYVGATNNFIRWPFIVEGMVIGVLASAISIVIVGGAYSVLAEQAVNASIMKNIGLSLVSFKDMISSIIVVYMLLGIGIGAIGSVISMRKYLKV